MNMRLPILCQLSLFRSLPAPLRRLLTGERAVTTSELAAEKPFVGLTYRFDEVALASLLATSGDLVRGEELRYLPVPSSSSLRCSLVLLRSTNSE